MTRRHCVQRRDAERRGGVQISMGRVGRIFTAEEWAGVGYRRSWRLSCSTYNNTHVSIQNNRVSSGVVNPRDFKSTDHGRIKIRLILVIYGRSFAA